MLSPLHLSLLIFITVSGLIVSYVAHLPLILGFLFGFFTLLFLSLKMGIRWETLIKGIKTGAWQTKEVVWILSFVGLLIPAWTSCGTIPYMIQLGLSSINATYFLTYSFIAISMIALLLGTSTGSLSIIGLPLIGMGSLFHIPLPLVAGALVSGAFIGDRTSPFSSANQLVAISTQTPEKEQNRALLPTTFLSVLASLLFFYLVDLHGNWQTGQQIRSGYSFSSFFWFGPILLLPPIVLVTAILLRIKTKYAFILGILASIFIGSFCQGVSPHQWVHDLLFGYNQTPITILHSKGLFDMLDLIVFIALTGSFNGILEETGVIQPYIKKVLGTNESLPSSTIRVALFGFGMSLVACNQTLPIMISGRNFLPIWTIRFKSSQLSRVIADSCLVFAGLVPWNMLAILCSTILGVPVLSYLPYAIFLLILPFITILFSYYECKKLNPLSRPSV
jgi:Na+:H+ antiporter, NhaC family